MIYLNSVHYLIHSMVILFGIIQDGQFLSKHIINFMTIIDEI
jgi:hypothetical protein